MRQRLEPTWQNNPLPPTPLPFYTQVNVTHKLLRDKVSHSQNIKEFTKPFNGKTGQHLACYDELHMYVIETY